MRILTAGMMMLATAAALHAQEPSAGVLPQIKVVTGGTFGFISEQLVGGIPVKGAPYSAQAVTETTQTLADGNRIVQKSTAMVYRDSLGRERREETLRGIGSFCDCRRTIADYLHQRSGGRRELLLEFERARCYQTACPTIAAARRGRTEIEDR